MIILKNVRVHNLKGVDLILEPGKLIAFTGVSGSGKSSLALDTIYREGQRRTLETLPHSSRRFIQIPEAPEADRIDGLTPSVAIDQRRAGHNPRSTVATLTGIYDSLRSLFARIAVPHDPITDEPLLSHSLEQILAILRELPDEQIFVLAPYADRHLGSDKLRAEGFLRLRVDGAWVDLEESSVDIAAAARVELLIDRVRTSQHGRLAEALSHALDLGNGQIIIYFPKDNSERLFSRNLAHGSLEPRHFSFNHPDGMCDSCSGLGCEVCRGSRLKPYPSASRLRGKRISEVTALSIEEAASFLHELRPQLQFLLDIGLGYITLDRPVSTLSGGELQRARLAQQLSAGLVGATYILDEPSLGLHPSDHQRLIHILYNLRDRGNTVIVVEHDADLIRAADTIVDIGPGAGEEGGTIVAQGTLDEILQSAGSLTGAYLSGREKIAPPRKRRKPTDQKIEIRGATAHNLQNLSTSIPLGLLTCITGVSGSGKSSLVSELFRAKSPLRILSVDQSPIGRSPRSTCATYLKLFDEIREIFAALPETKLRGWTSAQFSFNAPEGACPHCKGLGVVEEELALPCPVCEGRRFRSEILAILYRGHSIADILAMTIRRAREALHGHTSLCKKFDLLCEIGLGYLPLGQTAPTFSGGEAQRLKLAVDLLRPSKEKLLYLFDEPTSGLHFHDIRRLLAILQERVDAGHTVLVIEHNLDLIRAADWIIDLGPGAGASGGRIVGEGTPDQIARLNTLTGRALRGELHTERTSPQTIYAAPTNIQVHNLHIPYNRWIAFAGPADAIYADSHYRYLETLPPYFRQALPQPIRPNIEIRGLPLTISIRPTNEYPALLAEMRDLIRRIFAYETARRKWTPTTLAELLKEQFPKKLISILATLTPHPDLPDLLRTLGFLRVRLNGTIYELDEDPPFANAERVELVIDQVEGHQSQRLREALELSDRHSCGPLLILVAGKEFSPPEENRIHSHTLDTLCALPLTQLKRALKSFPLPEISTQLTDRTDLLCSLDLGHLSIDQPGFSTGERQLLRLAQPLFSGLSSSLYIIEEPSRGFDTAERKKIFDLLRRIRDRGNTLLVIDQNLDTIRAADLLIGCHLPKPTPLPKKACDAITCITGPTGSGKSQLLQHMRDESTFEHTLYLDAQPIHQNLRSDVGTYSGLLPLFRTLFASLPAAKSRGWSASHFSSNHPRGMCTQCRGLGYIPLRLHFQPATEIPCDACRGSRLNPVSLTIHYKGKHLGLLSQLPIAELAPLFDAIPRFHRRLQLLIDLGLSHLHLNQETSTLSIGEGQRLRLFTQLAKWMPDPTLYLFDNPSAGLPEEDLARLIPLFQRLADAGHTLVYVDCHPALIALAGHEKNCHRDTEGER